MEAQNERDQTLTTLLDYLEPFVVGDLTLLSMLIVSLGLWYEELIETH